MMPPFSLVKTESVPVPSASPAMSPTTRPSRNGMASLPCGATAGAESARGAGRGVRVSRRAESSGGTRASGAVHVRTPWKEGRPHLEREAAHVGDVEDGRVLAAPQRAARGRQGGRRSHRNRRQAATDVPAQAPVVQPTSSRPPSTQPTHLSMMLSLYWMGMDQPAKGTILPAGKAREAAHLMRLAIASNAAPGRASCAPCRCQRAACMPGALPRRAAAG